MEYYEKMFLHHEGAAFGRFHRWLAASNEQGGLKKWVLRGIHLHNAEKDDKGNYNDGIDPHRFNRFFINHLPRFGIPGSPQYERA